MPKAAEFPNAEFATPADTKPFDRFALLGPHSVSMMNYSNRCIAVLAAGSFRLEAEAQSSSFE